MKMTRKSNTVPRTLAVLKLPEYAAPRLLVQARAIVQSMTGNAWFPAPLPSLKTVHAAIDALDAAQTATLARTAGTVAARDEKRLALVLLLQQLCSHVQATADATPESAATIIESAGMSVKAPRALPARVFAAKPGDVSGAVKLVAPVAGHRAGYEWAYSTDGGTKWDSSPVTVRSSTTVTALQPGTTVRFRYRAATKNGVGDWSEAVSIIVV
jgi:hypothetical protein